MANRVWSYFFGRGIIEPVDDIRASNPAANPPLLDALTKDFVDHHFDLRHLIRTMVNSRTYQLSFHANEWNGDDEINFSHAAPRRLTAEELFDGSTSPPAPSRFSRSCRRISRPSSFPIPASAKAASSICSAVPSADQLRMRAAQRRQPGAGAEPGQRLDHRGGRGGRERPGSKADSAAARTGRSWMNCTWRRSADRRSRELDRGGNVSGEGMNRAERAQDLLWALLNSKGFLYIY